MRPLPLPLGCAQRAVLPAVFLVAVGCGDAAGLDAGLAAAPDAALDAGAVDGGPAGDGGFLPGEGVCCPRATARTCPGGGLQGGWAESEAACDELPRLGSQGEFVLRIDERGCERWSEEGGFCSGDERCCVLDER